MEERERERERGREREKASHKINHIKQALILCFIWKREREREGDYNEKVVRNNLYLVEDKAISVFWRKSFTFYCIHPKDQQQYHYRNTHIPRCLPCTCVYAYKFITLYKMNPVLGFLSVP